MSRTYYQALEINDFSNREEIVHAYRRLAMKWHPDRNNNPDAEQIFIEIQTAYEILKDDEHRQYYDAWLREQYAPKSTTQHTHERNFYDSKMAQDARDFAYRYADMSFDEFSKKLKVKAKKAALTVFHGSVSE